MRLLEIVTTPFMWALYILLGALILLPGLIFFIGLSVYCFIRWTNPKEVITELFLSH